MKTESGFEVTLWSWVVTKDGRTVQVTHDDMSDLKHEDILRAATKDEVDKIKTTPTKEWFKTDAPKEFCKSDLNIPLNCLEPKDLRIGNIVRYNCDGKEIHFIKQCDLDKTSLSFFEPETLTYEWVQMLGFECRKIYDAVYEHVHESKTNDFRLFECTVSDPSLFEIKFDLSEIEVKYVHQLQNLHFALTGVELELKAKVN